MAWNCKLVVLTEEQYNSASYLQDLPIGSIFYAPLSYLGKSGFTRNFLFPSRDYLAHRDGQRPLFVRLPGMNVWCIDADTNNGGSWAWTGTPPNITVSPSINYVGSYHGWVRDGVVTDDCEGRRFPDGI